MATQFSLTLADKPGSLAKVAETLGQAGVNIDGLAGLSASGQGVIKLVASDTAAAEQALTSEGFDFRKEEVLLIRLEDKPGQVATFARTLANESINFSSFYITMQGQQVVATDNIPRTKEIAQKLGIL